MTSRRLLWPSILASAFLFVSCVSQEPGEEGSVATAAPIGAAIGVDEAIRLDIEVQGTASAAAPRPLKVMLSNDDGWSDPGIQAMKRGLVAAGHSVTLIAPAQDRSGSSVSLTGPGPVTVTTQAEGDLAVDGSPATCVLIGLAIFEARGEKPDLVVSGPNFGFDGGPSAPYSGTLGAATTGLIRGIPSIALMADPISRDKTDPRNKVHFERVAEFTGRLIARLQTASGKDQRMLPEGVGLKVGYPALPVAEIPGVTLVTQGKTGVSHVNYREISPGVFGFARGEFEPIPGDHSGEVVNFRAGYITVLPFEADLTANLLERHQVRRSLTGLRP